MHEPDWLVTIIDRLERVGLDLARAFDAAKYDVLAAEHSGLASVSAFGRRNPLALLVGNTAAMWPHFVASYHGDAALRAAADPVDTWVAAQLADALLGCPVPYRLHLASDRGEELVSMLRAVEASGMARVGPAHLAVHPQHGPWFGLRALVVFDADSPSLAAEASPDPCAACDAPCVPAMQAALATVDAGVDAPDWRVWVHVRDACPVGRASRYSEDQLVYHYTKRRSVLEPNPTR